MSARSDSPSYALSGIVVSNLFITVDDLIEARRLLLENEASPENDLAQDTWQRAFERTAIYGSAHYRVAMPAEFSLEPGELNYVETIQVEASTDIVSEINVRRGKFCEELGQWPKAVILGPEESLRLKALRESSILDNYIRDLPNKILGMDIIHSSKPGINFELTEGQVIKVYSLLKNKQQELNNGDTTICDSD